MAFMGFLRQATASQTRNLGPFVDVSDGATEEGGLTIANTDIRLSINGGNYASKNSGGATYDESGEYHVTFDATDTATCGQLDVVVHDALALIVKHTWWVLEENVYDALFAASAALGTDVASILTDTGTTLDGKIDTIDDIVDAILVDTGTTIPGTLTTISGNVDAVLVDTGTTLNDKIDLIDTNIDSILATTDFQVRGGVAYSADDNLKAFAGLYQHGSIVNCTDVTMAIVDYDGDTVLADGDWDTAVAEDATTLVWYAAEASASAIVTVGNGYYLRVVATYGGNNYTGDIFFCTAPE